MNTEIAVASNVALMGGADFSERVQERSKALDRRSLVIADSGIKDVEVLLAQLDEGTDFLSVDSSADFGNLLKEVLNGGYERLHFLGHGQSGEIRFGDRALHFEDFTAVSPNEGNVKIPSLHFWSCMTGAGMKGRAFVEGIAKAFGAAVTAFSDLVGAKGLGGSWSPDVCSHEAGFVGAPFANALAYKYTLQTSVLNLIAVPTATGEDVQVWLKGGIAVNGVDLVVTYDTTKATYTTTVGNTELTGWIWQHNEISAGNLITADISGTFAPISSSSDILLETIALFFPVMQVEPLDVADTGWRFYLSFALDENSLNVAAFCTDSNGYLVEADAPGSRVECFERKDRTLLLCKIPSMMERRHSSPNLILFLSNQTSCPRFSKSAFIQRTNSSLLS